MGCLLIGDNKIVGRSTHSIEQVRAAISEGADYIGFGPLYETRTKPGRPAIGLNDIVQAKTTFIIWFLPYSGSMFWQKYAKV